MQSCSGASLLLGDVWEKHPQPSRAEVGAVMGGLTIGDPGPRLGISRWFAREDRLELNGNRNCL